MNTEISQLTICWALGPDFEGNPDALELAETMLYGFRRTPESITEGAQTHGWALTDPAEIADFHTRHPDAVAAQFAAGATTLAEAVGAARSALAVGVAALLVDNLELEEDDDEDDED